MDKDDNGDNDARYRNGEEGHDAVPLPRSPSSNDQLYGGDYSDSSGQFQTVRIATAKCLADIADVDVVGDTVRDGCDRERGSGCDIVSDGGDIIRDGCDRVKGDSDRVRVDDPHHNDRNERLTTIIDRDDKLTKLTSNSDRVANNTTMTSNLDESHVQSSTPYSYDVNNDNKESTRNIRGIEREALASVRDEEMEPVVDRESIFGKRDDPIAAVKSAAVSTSRCKQNVHVNHERDALICHQDDAHISPDTDIPHASTRVSSTPAKRKRSDEVIDADYLG